MSERLAGTVKWFNHQKGFGFIMPENGGEDLFVHQSSIRTEGFRTLGDGESVEFQIETDGDGRTKAVDVTGPEERPVQGRPSAGGGVRGGRNYFKCGKAGHMARHCCESGGSHFLNSSWQSKPPGTERHWRRTDNNSVPISHSEMSLDETSDLLVALRGFQSGSCRKCFKVTTPNFRAEKSSKFRRMPSNDDLCQTFSSIYPQGKFCAYSINYAVKLANAKLVDGSLTA